MLLQQKLTTIHLSQNETIIVKFIKQHTDDLYRYSIRDIASITHTSTSNVLRLAKKLGYDGFDAFKKDYMEEIQYIRDHFQNIDANTPFTKESSIMEIVKINEILMKECVTDTTALLNYDTLNIVSTLLSKANKIIIFGKENNHHLIELFKYKMLRINKLILGDSNYGNGMYYALQANQNDIAILISYSGETEDTLNIAKKLKENNVRIITITSIGSNSLTNLGNYNLYISTRERLKSKIGPFSSEYSIMLILNILYSLIFNTNYDEHLKYRLSNAKELEIHRHSSSMLLQED